jgi:hypothetical protein
MDLQCTENGQIPNKIVSFLFSVLEKHTSLLHNLFMVQPPGRIILPYIQMLDSA